MNSDIANTLGMVRQRIRKLQQMEQMLVEEFGDVSTPISSHPSHVTPTNGHGNGNVQTHGTGFGSHNRREQLVTFLTQHGPATRSKINDESGIPKGTIANLLNKPGFVRRDGKWHVDTGSATQEITH